MVSFVDLLAAAGLLCLPLLLLLFVWNVVLAYRLRQLAARTAEQQVHLAALEAQQLAAPAPPLAESVRHHVAPLLTGVRQGPAPDLTTSLTDQLVARATERVAVLTPAGALDDLVREQLDDLLADPPEELLQAIQARLANLVARTVESPSAGLTGALTVRIEQAFSDRLEEILGDLPAYEQLADALDRALSERIVRQTQALAGEGGGLLARKIERGLGEHVERVFESTEEYEGLFEKINEKLTEWIIGVIRNIDSALPAEVAQALTRTVGAGLLARVEAFFEEPTDYEALVDRFDDKLAERIVRMAGAPSAPTAEALDARVGLFLVRRAERFLERPAEFPDLHDRLDRAFTGRLAAMLADPPREVLRRLEELVASEVLRRQGALREQVAEELTARIEGWVRESVDRAGPEVRQVVRAWLEERAQARAGMREGG